MTQPEPKQAVTPAALQARAAEWAVTIPHERLDDIVDGARQLAAASARLRAFLAEPDESTGS